MKIPVDKPWPTANSPIWSWVVCRGRFIEYKYNYYGEGGNMFKFMHVTAMDKIKLGRYK